MTSALVSVAAADVAKSPNGALGLVVFLVLAVAVAFLFRSMNRHLRKAARMKLDEETAKAAAKAAATDADTSRTPPRPQS
jgi:hypothetical protein